ncbi:acyl-CoA dehydrogenase family protein [Streptomyces sp. ISL-100]|uniref:acyl-CoA dehydrogenase family protein n=1 Tax=Streptomyces sp. ISL-100 TaxID=2819173 RepID=UPI001BE6FDE3|nr:acyl-CoA dehydrogenase family protein [Streptomyces sp. ISL-100]MBT2399303.1 hypothetical protein [Streptomyces sp. ISL-100]
MPTTTHAALTRAAWAHHAAAQGARYATESEQARTLHPAVAETLVQDGFARYFVPVGFGGTAGTFAELLDAVALVGEGCTSAAWCAALQAAHGRLAAHLPHQGQADLWGSGADIPIAAAVVPPAGELTPVPGGYLLTGRWNLASGVDHAHWILLAAPERADGDHRQWILAVPRADISIHDTWRNSGLRGTGSHSVTVDAAFVPEHRTVLREALAAGRDEEGAARCHRIPYTLVASLIFAAPALGAARGALRAWITLAAGRTTAGGGRFLEEAVAQDALVRSSAEIDAAHLLLRRAAERADQAPLDDLPVALNMRDAAVAVEMLVGAVERLFRSGGARAQAEGEPLQRLWRDVHALAGHGALQLPLAARAYGQWVAADVAAR